MTTVEAGLHGIEARIAGLEDENRKREKDIAMHGQMKDQLIDAHIRTQGAIEELKKLIQPKEEVKK